MNNSTIDILEQIMAKANEEEHCPWLWKLNKSDMQDVVRYLEIKDVRHYSGSLFNVPIDPTFGYSCLICENKIYYVL